jgi:osmotically-inducible protein OsmY
MKRKVLLLFSLFASVAACDESTKAPDRKPVTTDRAMDAGGDPVAADNTKKNVRDRDAMAVTPGDQSEKKDDIAITREIRQEVMKKDLSVTAKNIKIMTIDGVVTLRGSVKSAAEKIDIATCVKNVHGVKKLDNQLEVAAK